jgi:pyridoxamine 5'-phosphate oxidase
VTSPDPSAMRADYGRDSWDRNGPTEHWWPLFAEWFAARVEFCQRDGGEPNAMVLATADAAGRPSARTVLLKGCDADGLVFFTNYTSRKGTQLAANPQASVVFSWFDQQRQVTFGGPVEQVSADRSAEYFASRPRGSQLGAWASHQSQVIGSRADVEERYAELDRRWPKEVPLPPFWGGFLLRPDEVEFWAGRPDRLHDRLRYRQEADAWIHERLAP